MPMVIDDIGTVQLNRAFGDKGPEGYTENLAKQLLDSERSGRLERGAQVASNSRVGHWEFCEFKDEGILLSPSWIDFGHIRFTEKPDFSSGSQAATQEGEAPLASDYSNYDPSAHLRVPGECMVACWRQDPNGYFSGAKLLFYALANVPSGYRVWISGTFSGPAVRYAEQTP
jgi:hypothetical protein